MAGCQASRTIVPGTVAADTSVLAESAENNGDLYPDYKIGPDDILAINVFREPDLSAESVRVDSSGRFEMPLIGRVNAVNRTPDDLSQEITQRLNERFLVNPNVSVNLIQSNSKRITVEGEVESPGVFPMSGRSNLLSSVALAGGPGAAAKLDQIAVFRKVNGQNMVAVFDLAQIRSGEMANPDILPGDIVVVGFSSLRKGFEDVIGIAPIFAIFRAF